MILTYKYRIKDRSAKKVLRRQATACNQIWNYCAAYQRDVQKRYLAGAPKRKWPTEYDFHKLTSGVSKELAIHSGTINEVCRVFCEGRSKYGRSPQFRASSGARRALGWVPFKRSDRVIEGNSVKYLGRRYRFWLGNRPLPANVRAGAFVEDALGRWYVCFSVSVEKSATCSTSSIGVDLGLSSFATFSDGRKVPSPKFYRKAEASISRAHRAGNKRRARAIHARVRNSRADFLHKLTTSLVREFAAIAVGDIRSRDISFRSGRKAARDAGWSIFKRQLRYKCQQAGAAYFEVDENFTTQLCSGCGAVPCSSPKGMGALGIRQWVCTECGESHDRDVNAARNILISALSAQRRGDESRSGRKSATG